MTDLIATTTHHAPPNDLRASNIYLIDRWARDTEPREAFDGLKAAAATLRRRGARVTSWWDSLARHRHWLDAIAADAAAITDADLVVFIGDADDPAAWAAAEALAVPVTRLEDLIPL